MFIAHLPSGYLLTKALPLKSKKLSLWLTGIFFAAAPDIDLLWFYFVSNRRVPHHQFFTHWPFVWLAVFAAAFALSVVLQKKTWRPYILVAFLAVMLHFILDSIAGEIYWLAPFSKIPFNLVHVQAVGNRWWAWNFILHWTFFIEIAICLAALAVFAVSWVKNYRTAAAFLSSPPQGES